MDLDRLKDRIGIHMGRKDKLEHAVEWASANGLHYIEMDLDAEQNALPTFLGPRGDKLRKQCENSSIKLGLHTLSSMNVAEVSPFVAEAADEYLKGYIDVAVRIGAGWVVVHAGFHFTSDYDQRRAAALERLKRVASYAEKRGALLLLENMNREPDDAEIHYLGFNFEEWDLYLQSIQSPALQATLTVNHAHLVSEGIDGHLDAVDMKRLREVRLADNKGDKEDHLCPGEGTIDFVHLFNRLEKAGFAGHYMNAFGSRADMMAGRDYYVDALRRPSR